MKAMRKVSRGNSFRGVLDYNSKNSLIGGNMLSRSIRGLASEFGRIRRRRPDILKPVWHQALRLPKGEQRNESEWLTIVQEYLHRLGFDDSHQYAVFLEDDPEGQHVHIISNRVSASGQVYLGRNENLASTRICSQLEKVFGLRVTPGATADELGRICQPDRRSVTTRELQKAVRTAEVPPRMTLQQLIDHACSTRPTTRQFIERLATDGVRIVPNIASTGRVSGMRFSMDGEVWFSGSQLGAAYKWGALCQRIDYDQDRDAQYLGDIKDAIAEMANSGDLAGAASRADAATPGDGGTRRWVEPTAERLGKDQRAPFADGQQVGTITGSNQVGGQNAAEAVAAFAGSDSLCADGTNHRSGDGGMGTSHRGRTSDRDRHGDTDTATGGGVEKAVARSAWLDHQVTAVNRMQRALGAPMYRVTARDRVAVSGPGRTHVLHPDRRPMTAADRKQGEPFLTPIQLAGWVSSGAAATLNAHRFDVYVTPIDPDHHYLLIDDVKGLDGVKALKRLGYRPALVQRTSAGNYQVILKVQLSKCFDREIEAANRIVQKLNRHFGDPKVSGGQHAFRLAGLRNKKPGRGDAVVEINWGESSPGSICPRATAEMAIERASLTPLAQESSQATATATVTFNKTQRSSVVGPADGQRYAAICAGIERQFTRSGAVIDRSAVDYRTAISLLKDGWATDRVGKAMHVGSPDLAARHADVEGYIARTVAAAGRAVDLRTRSRDPPKPKSLGGPSIAP